MRWLCASMPPSTKPIHAGKSLEELIFARIHVGPVYSREYIRKILAPIEIKSALHPPPNPPPKTRNFMDMAFPAERTHFCQASMKLAQPFPAPESRTKNFTDTRICLNIGQILLLLRQFVAKERRRGRAEKRLSKRVFLESRFLCPLEVCS